MPDPAVQPNNIPTMTVRPAPKTEGDGGKAPAKLSYDDMVAKWTARGYPKAAAQGIADNMTRESGGDPTAIGDHGTSRGLFQEHDTRKGELEAAAKKAGKSPDDPDLQIDFANEELKTKFPTLYKQLMAGTDRAGAEDSFKRIFERPASILWQNNPNLASDKYRYSDYAMKEHDGRKNTDLVYMSPADYLDLSPELDGKPFSNPSGRALKSSVDRGEPVESVPTLDMQVDGNTGTVTDQDGRHRALLAQQSGVDAIPVAIRQKGQGTPTEIVGASGNIVPNDFRKAADVPKAAPRPAANAANPTPNQDPISLQGQDQPAAGQPAQPDQRSMLGRLGDALNPVSRAEAAEPGAGSTTLGAPVDYDPFAGSAGGQEPGAPQDTTLGAPVDHDPFAQPDGMLMSAVKGAGAGLGKTVLAGQELVGQGLEAVGATAPGQWLVNDARKGIANLGQEIAPDQAAHPYATGAGEIGGSMALPGGIAGKIGGNALRVAAIGGGLSGLLTPSSGDGAGYWGNKALQTGAGAAGGAVTGKVGNALAGMVAPKLQAAVGKLMNEGVQLTPGQMAGGAVKAAEDKLTSVPITGDAINAARRRSYEDFNRAAWNRVLAPLGEKMPGAVSMGRTAMDYVGGRLDDAYSRILPHLNLTAVQNDPAWVSDMTAAINGARGSLPDAEFKTFENITRAQLLEKLGAAGTSVDGKLINGIDSQLGSEVRGYKSSGEHDKRKIGAALEEVQHAFRDLLERQNPNQAGDLRKVREAYANFVRVGNAASSTGTARTEGIFSPAQLNAAVRAENKSTRKMDYGKGRALLQDLSDAGMAVLPSNYPDSGSVGRYLMAGLAGGAGGTGAMFGHPAGLVGMLAGAAPYTAPASRVTNAIVNRMAQTPGPTRNALAEIFRRSGALAAPAAGSLAAGSIPSMVVHPGSTQ